MKHILRIIIPNFIVGLLVAGLIVVICYQKAYIEKLETENREQYEQELSLLSPEGLIEESINCINKHNHLKYALTMRWEKEMPSLKSFGKDNVEYWKLLEIKEVPVDRDHKEAEIYDIKRFSVEGEVKWKNDRKSPHHSGEFTWNYTLIKPNENDRWYIAGKGFG